MNAAFVNPFLSSFIHVLQTMAMTEVKAGQASLKKDSVARGDVSGLIGMVGPTVSGSFSISFEKKLALSVFQKMLGESVDNISEEIIDMVGEITNMVAGGAKQRLSEKGYDFNMAIPIVVTGDAHSITHQIKASKVLMPFQSEQGNAYIEICFTE